MIRTYVRLVTGAVWMCIFAPCTLGGEQQSSVCGVVVDLLGNPIRAATVEALQASAPSMTDGNGEFCLRNMPPGDTLVSVAYPGFRRQQRSVKVLAGSNALADFVLSVGRLGDPPSRTVTGIIEAGHGRPLVGVRIVAMSCFDPSVGSETLSDGLGKFTISLPEPGQYCIRCWTPGHTARTEVVMVPGGIKPWTTTIRFTLLRLSLSKQ